VSTSRCGATEPAHGNDREFLPPTAVLPKLQPLYITGGRQKKRLFKTEEEHFAYEQALIVEVDPATMTSSTRVSYESPAEARANEDSSILFKGGALKGKKLFVCTATEVLIFDLPQFRITGYVSLPCFNDLHHVCPKRDGNLLVASTGLDMVVECTLKGEVVQLWNVLGGKPWERFSPTTDYRKIPSTKPHLVHPNYIFELEDNMWVTRHYQRDAISLTGPNRRISIGVGVEKPHDGVLFGDRIVFTTVDGTLALVSRNTLRVEEIIDLKTIDNEEKALLGWCRGLMVVDQDRIWVGFTRVRKTKFVENINWVKHTFQDVEMPTHIALYDIAAKRCLRVIDLEKHGLNLVFSILPAGCEHSIDPSTPVNGSQA
jgi:hypothetical protein